MREPFAVQKLLTFFQQKYRQISDIDILNFNDTLTNDVVSFEKPGPARQFHSCRMPTLTDCSQLT